jgi:hypothetical protein
MAFIDTQIYITDMAAIKNFVIAGDIAHSTSVLRFRVWQ